MTEAKGKRLLGMGAGMAVVLAGPSAAQAASTFTVNTNADETNGSCATTCSLRDAITLANGDAGSTIQFASNVTGTILLGSNLPAFTKTTTVSGPGATKLTLSGQDAHAIFAVTPPAMQNASLTVENLTLTDGLNAQGGGIRGSNRSSITLLNSEITSSTATISGGAVSIRYGSVVIEGSTISGNAAIAGGAIAADYSSVLVKQSTLTGNNALGSGGAVAAVADALYNGSVSVRGSTISGNSAGIAYGGITPDAESPISIYSSIFTGNTPVGTYTNFTAEYSILPASVTGVSATNLSGDPRLGPLKLNGGETRTMLPAFNGAGVDKGASHPTEPTDQRGLTRLVDVPSIANANPAFGPGTDIGAVELTLDEAKPPPPPPPGDKFDLTSALKKCKKKKSKKAKKKCKKKARKRAKAAAAAGATIV